MTYQEYLAALGLYTLAQQAQRQSDAALNALAKHLGKAELNDISNIADEIYGPRGKTFAEVLASEGFTIPSPE